MKYLLLLSLSIALMMSCQSDSSIPYGNPPAEGFNATDSDEQAIAIADKVMEAMGGRQAWDETKEIKWTFFGRRTHLWDKENNTVEIKVPGDNSYYELDMNDMSGTVTIDGESITQPDSLNKYLTRAHEMWINDSYWLVMPYKLKDSGVTLKYVGQDTTTSGKNAEVLELTFADVGVTPDNKYHVYVDPNSHLVTQWDFYTNYNDTTARFQSPWPNYQQYGNLMLSGGQIAGNKLTDIEVGDNLSL